ncbi:MAG TPA: hypothetical protein VI968_01105 [archaeon]|nr:hypothetical protein [archaeon]
MQYSLSDSPVPKKVLARAIPYNDPYVGEPREFRIHMERYAGRGVVGFMRPGENFFALDVEGHVPYMGENFTRIHELEHHRRHSKKEEQNETGPHSVNSAAAYKMGMNGSPFASY